MCLTGRAVKVARVLSCNPTTLTYRILLRLIYFYSYLTFRVSIFKTCPRRTRVAPCPSPGKRKIPYATTRATKPVDKNDEIFLDCFSRPPLTRHKRDQDKGVSLIPYNSPFRETFPNLTGGFHVGVKLHRMRGKDPPNPRKSISLGKHDVDGTDGNGWSLGLDQ